jgi:hypothetical protein
VRDQTLPSDLRELLSIVRTAASELILCSSVREAIDRLKQDQKALGAVEYVASFGRTDDEIKAAIRRAFENRTEDARFTFEGYANQMWWGGEGGVLNGYSHLFRNGTIENVNAGFLDQSPAPEPATSGDVAQLYWLEIQIMDCAERMLKIMELLEVPGPYYLLVAFLNVQGLRVTSAEREHFFLRDVRTIDRANLILPEVLLESADISIEAEMRSSFDMIWNAAGWKRSFSYDEHGAHKNENWRKPFG